MRRCVGALALVLGLAGCDGAAMDDAGPGDAGAVMVDAGIDAGGVDAGVDGGFDAGTDAGPPCTAYADTDEDGFGDPAAPVIVACDRPLPPMTADNADDCDDTSDLVNPDASFRTEPRPGGGWDWNCDGDVDMDLTDWTGCPMNTEGWMRFCVAFDGPRCSEWSPSELPACGTVADYRTGVCAMTTRTQACR